MNKLYSSKNLAFLGTLGLGVIAATGIATAPAQAADFEAPLSTLEWDDGTDDFNPEVVIPPNNTGSNVFDVVFSPPNLGGVASVFIATGDFNTFFEDPPAVELPQFFPIDSGSGTQGQFSFVSFDAPAGSSLPDLPEGGNAAYYKLDNNLEFEFDTNSVVGNGGPVTATLPQDSIFEVVKEPDGAVSALLEGGALGLGEWEFTLPATATSPAKTATATDSVFEFGDLVGTDGGTYDAEGEVVHERVPEPASILGLLAVGGLGMAMKSKKQL